MAAAGDYFVEVGDPGSATTLAAPGYTVGNTSVTVASTTNWPSATGVVFAIDEIGSDGLRIDGTYNVYQGTVATATSITNVSHISGTGTDRNYSAGATTRVYIIVASEIQNRLVEGILVHADQDGTLKAGAVDVAAVLASNVVTTAKILDGNVTTAKIFDGAVTPSKLDLDPATTTVATSQTTTSTSYTDLATAGPAATVTIGANGLALVIITGKLFNSGVNDTFMGYAVSGANTVAATDTTAQVVNSTPGQRNSTMSLLTGLTPGSTTFTAKYRVAAGTGTFSDRNIIVIPL